MEGPLPLSSFKPPPAWRANLTGGGRRSGALRLEEATLHVVLAATHTFDKDLVDTVVQVQPPSRPVDVGAHPHSLPGRFAPHSLIEEP